MSEPFQELPEPGRHTDGTFAPGNVVALKHGAFSRRVIAGALEGQEEAIAALVQRQAAIAADLGGRENLSALQADLVRRYVELSLILDWLMDNVLSKGALTPKGNQRAALNAALQVQAQTVRLAEKLGLERRSKRVDLARAFAEHERGGRNG